ncbi:MAG: TIGR00730 family Rossman fold protein [Burkholderiales bacterium]|nr:TIGR00730 family Rossman fold protein [Burkholderiales bacterium]
MGTNDKLPKVVSAGIDPAQSSAREAWQLLGIMSEFVEATERLNQIRPAVSIFGSARMPAGHPYYELAERIARLLSDAGFAVISGGGPGIMEAANKGAHFGRSPAVGLNIELPREQFGNTYQDISLSFRHFFARKVTFIRFATAYVVMPGGFGTLDELTEALTLVQTEKIRRLPVILVHEPFWRGLVDWFRDRLVAEGMISPGDIDLVQTLNEPEAVVEAIFRYYEKGGFTPTPADRERTFLNL